MVYKTPIWLKRPKELSKVKTWIYYGFGACIFLVLFTLFLRKPSTDHNPLPTRNQQHLHYISKLSTRYSVCVAFIGRLGNQMFQYASAFGIAKTKNMTVRVGKHSDVAKYFNLSAVVYSSVNYCGHAFKVYERQHCAFDAKLLNISVTQDTMLLEYLQSWVYFKNVETDLRQEFTFNDKIMAKAKSILNNLTNNSFSSRESNTTYIGIHIRRGDMVNEGNNTQNNYYVADTKYILQAIRFYIAQFPGAVFVVCSDDMQYATDELSKYTNIFSIVFVDKNPAFVDMALLSLCDHIIMTTGTFGWWAGWLAGGMVVYYKNYIKEDSALRKEFSKGFKDYFYPGWIAME